MTGREGFELKEKKEEKEEKMRRTYSARECPFLPPAESEGKILQFVLIGFAGGARGRRTKLKTNKTLLICNCYLGVEQIEEMPNKEMI